jgi:hypothetical protein
LVRVTESPIDMLDLSMLKQAEYVCFLHPQKEKMRIKNRRCARFNFK